ncbi:hypothetical protein [uncultured Kocuria sp.]|uniref:hypothetical protein n=1 Tax=uncultured Kocuria sp. TaxID=259305 RepID=UPI00260B4892|nr:hypothetical protein [uncultured Kocuria sp.]
MMDKIISGFLGLLFVIIMIYVLITLLEPFAWMIALAVAIAVGIAVCAGLYKLITSKRRFW